MLVLGPVRLSAAGGQLRLDRPLERALATRLALARGNGVSDDTLARDLWGDDVARPTERLRVLASRMRRSLGPHADAVTRTPAGFALAAASVDLVAVEQAMSTLYGARRRHDTGEVRTAAAEALGHWRDTALADLRGFPFARTEGERLDSVRLDLQVDRIEADLEAETAGPGRADLERLAAAHPLHERLVSLSALALYRAGRQADALERLRRLRSALADELGVDPKPETADLELRMLRQEPSLSASAQARVETPVDAVGNGPGPAARLPELHWPAASTRFVGREGEHALLVERLTEPCVMTLTGGPGLGKTRLAREAAASLQQSGRPVAWLDLAPLRTPDAVVAGLVGALGLETGSDDPLRLCAEALTGALLVVDNAEHLIDTVAAVVADLVRRSDRLSVLVTSQRPLRIAVEELHQVLPLPPQAAAALFCSRSGADPGPDVDAICAAVDRLPLGIELAAGLMRTLTLRQIANRIHDRLRLLVGGPRDTGSRHTSLRAALDWSHDLLTDQGRVVLRRLSVFAGGCTLEAAEQVLPGAGTDAVDVAVVLAELAERCLVTVDSTADARRFGLLETVRGYALDKLDAAGEATAVRRRHVEWCAELAANAEQFGRKDPTAPVDQPALVRRIGHEEANLRAAVDWCLGAGGWAGRVTEFVAPLWWYWWYRGQMVEARSWLRQSLAAVDQPSPAYAGGLHALSMLTRNSGDYEEALQVGADCLAAYKALGDQAGVAVALHTQALTSIALAEPADALAYSLESERLARSTGSGRTVGGALNCAGLALRNLGRIEEATQRFTEALADWTAIGHRHGIVVATGNLGVVAREAGDLKWARELFGESLRVAREIGFSVGIVDNLADLGVLACARGDAEAGLRLLTVSDDQRARIGAPLYIPDEITARDTARTIARQALGPEAETVEAAARRLDLDAVVDAVLDVRLS